MRHCRYMEGTNIAPGNKAEAEKLIGKRVSYLRNIDIDRSGRGYIFVKHGTVDGTFGRHVIINGDYILFRSLVEMVERTEQ